MKPSVLLVSSRSDEGGGPRQAYGLAAGLSFDVKFVIALPPGGPYWDRFVDLLGGDQVLPIPERAVTPRAVARLIAVGRSRSVDLIHSHGFGAGLVSRPASIVSRIPVIHTYHGLHFDARGRLMAGCLRAVERELSRATAALIAVSQTERDQAVRLRLARPPERLKVIVNGVPVPRTGLASAGHRLGGRLRIVTVTRDNWQKDPELLVRVVGLAHRAGLVDRVDIACPAADVPRLRFLVRTEGLSDDLVEVGHRVACSPRFLDADVFLATSRWEGLPLAPLEAMAGGCPVVLTDVTGHRDIGRAGLRGSVQLFDRDRSGDAVRALRDMAALPQSGWDDLSAAAVETVAKHFGVDRMLEQTASLYRGVLGTARNRWRPGRARSA